MTNWEEIQREWETTKITLAALAEKHSVPLGTLKSRKSRDTKSGNEWLRGASKKDATKQKDAATKNVKVATEKNSSASARKNKSSSKGKKKKQKNRSGNPNPVRQFTKRNSAAVTHGLFSKYLPEDTLEIMEQMEERSPADLIYDQIQIQYAAIIRAQRIMYVEDRDDITKVLKKQKPGMFGDEREWEFQFAWDKHANFMNAQSRAMGELRSLIKHFCEISHDDDERRLRLEQMQLNVEKTQLELGNMRGDTEGDAHEQGSSYEEALNAQVEDVFADEVTDDAEA
ncbi:phage terminase small subunit [Sporosarcina jiandibaonis]|uniref:phage terminase small subunit n=1 Tax=Sporosarcina jiandibaonis TaxID=2715535 RepID=UPI001554B8E2